MTTNGHDTSQPAAAVPTRRLGTFVIPIAAIEQRPGLIKKALSTVIVVDARAIYPQGVIIYQALCDQFDPIPDGVPVPSYEAVTEPIAPGAELFKGWRRTTPKHPVEAQLVTPQTPRLVLP